MAKAYYATATAVHFEATLRQPSTGSGPLAWNDTTVTTLATRLDVRDLRFTLAEAGWVELQNLKAHAGQATVQVLTPSGTQLSSNSMTSASAAALRRLYLPAGQYVVRVSGAADGTTAEVRFEARQVPASQRLDRQPETQRVLAEAAGPATGALWSLAAAAGDRLQLAATTWAGAGSVQLLNPAGTVVSTWNPAGGTPLAVDLTTAGTWLLRVTRAANDSGFDNGYRFEASWGTAVAAQPVISTTNAAGVLAGGQKISYQFQADEAGLWYLDRNSILNYGSYYFSTARVLDANGAVISSNAWDAPLALQPGVYTLEISATSTSYNVNYDFTWRRMDGNQVPRVDYGQSVAAPLASNYGARIWRLDAAAGDRVRFNALASSASNTPRWALFNALGQPLNAQAGANVDGAAVPVADAGPVYLVVDWANYNYGSVVNGSLSFQFDNDAVAQPLPLVLGQTVSGTLDAATQQRSYTFTLDTARLLVLDRLNSGTGSSVTWSLQGPYGTDNSSTSLSPGTSTPSVRQLALSAGVYTLNVSVSGFVSSAYAFRLFDAAGALPLVNGEVVSGRVEPTGEMVAYAIDAEAGDRLFVDFRDLTTRTYGYDPVSGSYRYNYTGYVRLIDPYGRQVSGSELGDIEAVATVAGRYTVLLDGYYNQDMAAAYRLAVFVSPPGQPRVIDLADTAVAMDLVVRDLAVTAATGGQAIQSGSLLQVSWATLNQGTQPTLGDFSDRVIVRRAATGEVVAQVVVPYVEGQAGHGPLLPAQSVQRSVLIRLPDGPVGAGELAVTVETDTDNTQAERGQAEENNRSFASFTSALAAYANLQVTDLAITPDGLWTAGQAVTVSWATRNTGTAAATGQWTERLELLNLSTGVVVANIAQAFTAQAIAAGGQAARSASFNWPAGLNAIGQYRLRVVVDSLGEVPEFNAAGPLETDNSIDRALTVGPDLQTRNVRLLQTAVQAGDTVTLQWEDVNTGAVATPAAFQDRVVIRQRNADGSPGTVVVNTAVAFSGAAAAALAPGEARARSFSFTLPDGALGAGSFDITVTADSAISGAGVLFETNAAGTAEANNSAAGSFTAAPRLYADLSVAALVVPATAESGAEIQISWTVANLGNAPATGSWVDRIVLSTDAIAGNADDVVLANVTRSGGLAVGTQYVGTATVRIPTRLEGTYRIAVISDVNASVREPDTRGDNRRLSDPVIVQQTYADLVPTVISVPAEVFAARSATITWEVQNLGTVATDVSRWTDIVYLSPTPTLGSGAVQLGAVTRVGALLVGERYSAEMSVEIPRSLAAGAMYFIVKTDANSLVYELGRTANNAAAAAQVTQVRPEPKPNLVIEGLTAPGSWRVGATVQVGYTVHNIGNERLASYTKERLRLVDPTGLNAPVELANWGNWTNRTLEADGSFSRTLDITVPALAAGAWQLQVDADNGGYVGESNEADNVASIDVAVVSPDLSLQGLSTTGVLQGGEAVTLRWTTRNTGTAAATNVRDRIHLSRDGVVGAGDVLLGEVLHAAIAAGGSVAGELVFNLPVDLVGDWRLIVVTDATNANNENGVGENNNLDSLGINVARDGYADLAVISVAAPTRVIADPATVTIEWTVKNQGTGIGRTTQWVDRVIYSTNATIGDSDDIVLGTVARDTALEAGDSYTQSLNYRFGPAFSRHGTVVVRTDAAGAVWENSSEANNQAQAAEPMDVMPIAYADLQVTSVSTRSVATSGQVISVEWSVANRGIGITNTASWTDTVWLSANADGSGARYNLGSAGHLGQLAAGDGYSSSIQVRLPEGIQGDWFLNVGTGGPFEFIYGNNNTGSSVAVPVALSPSPDLVVDAVDAPTVAQEGALVDIHWTVRNQGEARAAGQWQDTVQLVAPDGWIVTLGTFNYDRGLEAGITYSRTEQVRLPGKIQGAYRLRVVTNSALGGGGTQIYEHGAARSNNTLVDGDAIEVSLNPRPDLRVTTVTVPTSVTAGTSAAVRYTVANMGPEGTSGQWTDWVYLSLDGILSGDDVLLARQDSASALNPAESYAAEIPSVTIPIRYRGDVFIIVVADANNRIDEYPSEANNTRAERLHVDPVPFGDLVTSNVVAPDQVVHGSTVEVRYQVTNKGSATTLGDTAAVNSWTDTVWLTVDKRRPSASKGDIKIGQITHTGHLAVGEDYLGTLNVQIPEGMRSGQYHLTVWSDTYDAILEDTLAVNINPDDAGQVDNNNYKARPMAVLGITPPDLSVTAAVAPAAAAAGAGYDFSYTVTNRADAFDGIWTDRVWVANNADLSKATVRWLLGEYRQERSLGLGESYSVTQSVALAPSVAGAFLVVETDIHNQVRETDESNNARNAASVISTAPADLRVSSVVTQPENFSGEATLVSWTVTNHGGAVWAGTRGWVDNIYFSSDPEFIPGRATQIGSVVHANTSTLGSGESYTASALLTLPAGTDGPYFIHVITDAHHHEGSLAPFFSNEAGNQRAADERLNGHDNASTRDYLYAASVYEGTQRSNNLGTGALNVTYREPDLQVGAIAVSSTNPASGETITVSWTVTNAGGRATRVNSWYDGIYLSRDTTLDLSDHPLVDRGNWTETQLRVRQTSMGATADGKPRYLQPGESYTNSATFTLPTSISGDFTLIVKADTGTTKDFYRSVPSTVRDGLDTVANNPGSPSGAVLEFRDEGNNLGQIALPISLSPPPDLQVTQVSAPLTVLAGQAFSVGWTVQNKGGRTPTDQGSWNDLVYLSKDRFLDLNKDRYLGYVAHNGGLLAGGDYTATLNFTAPRDLEGPYYVFVVTDPARAWGGGDAGRVLEFGFDDNNNGAALQPMLIETPPPADLQVTAVQLPASAQVGQTVQFDYTVTNVSPINPAYGRWTDAVYLSADNSWGLDDLLIGKVAHVGDLAANASYNGTLSAQLPPLKDGTWRIIVRPDLYNEVFEGRITYTDTGLNVPPGEANNRTASAATLRVEVPTLPIGTLVSTTLGSGDVRLYRLTVAEGETLRLTLDSSAAAGANEIWLRWGDIPTGYAFDAAYDQPVSPDQQIVIPSTKAGDYYLLVRSRQQAAGTPVTLRAELLPLAITRVTPDQGGTGDDAHRWVTMDIEGARFAPGALVKLSRPGEFEIEPARWQVIDATRIRATFDLRNVPHGLYDVVVTNPNGQRVVEPYRYLVERMVESDVTIGIGGARSIAPGDAALYSVSLQSLSNVDTPYVRFDVGATDMGKSAYVLEGLELPYVVFGSNVGGQPQGAVAEGLGNTQAYGTTPTTALRSDIPWAALDGMSNTEGWNLAPGYAFDVAAGGFVGFNFSVQTYPGLAEWLAYDFEGLRAKLYAIRPDWKNSGLLDGGVQDLNKISNGLAAKFLSREPDEHITKLEALAMPFRFDTLGAATPLTRAEFVADQTAHAIALRTAILADASAPATLGVLAADEAQWVQGWLAALETAGLLRAEGEAPPIRSDELVLSLNATLATGILIGRGGDSYRTQADLLGFFAKVQQWYGDTARYAGDAQAATAPVDYHEIREDDEGNYAEIPVPVAPDRADYDLGTSQETHFISFDVFAGGRAELEYLRHLGVLDAEFNPVGPQALNLTQYLQQAAAREAAANALIAVRGPQALPAADGLSYVPADYALPYTLSFTNPGEQAVGQLRLVTQLDADLDARTLRLGDLKIGDINVHLPEGRAVFQGDFDFSGSKGFVLRVSAGIDAQERVATWLIQAIDPDTGEVLRDPSRGLLLPDSSGRAGTGFVAYTVTASPDAATSAAIGASARVFFDDAPPIDSDAISHTLDASAPRTTITVTSRGNDAGGAPTFSVAWQATDDASGVKHVTVYVADNGGDFRIWRKQVAGAASSEVFAGQAGHRYEFLAVATDTAGNREAALVSNAVLPDDGSRDAAQQALGVLDTLQGTAQLPAATPDRSYVASDFFAQAALQLPGFVATAQPPDLRSVLAPMQVRAFGSGFAGSAGDIGALALVQLMDGSVLASAGTARNEVYRFAPEGGRSTTPLFTLDAAVLDMALDAVGQLWVMTGAELLRVDASSGAVIDRWRGPGDDPLAHALAIDPASGLIYVATGNGVSIFNPAVADGRAAGNLWRQFSSTRVGDLAFGPDGRLWGVRWTGSDIAGASPDATTEVISFPMSGRTQGRAEVEYRLAGLVDSIAFGAAGTPLAGLLFASSNLPQRPVGGSAPAAVPHGSVVWMVELQSRRTLQLAAGGTRGEGLLTTADGRILVAQTTRIDEIAPIKAPKVLATSIGDGALVPLPLTQLAVSFDQAMWTGSQGGASAADAQDPSSVLNPAHYSLISSGGNGVRRLQPLSVRWDAGAQAAILTLPDLPAGSWRLEVSDAMRSAAQVRLAETYSVAFTTVADLSQVLRLAFTDTRADRLTGALSYDVRITNIGSDDLRGPMLLLLDPGRYFADGIDGAVQGGGDQQDLWLINLNAALATTGGVLRAGATLPTQTVSVIPANRFGTGSANGAIVKANLGHGLYAVPFDNAPPQLAVVGASADQPLALPAATAGQAWTATLEALDTDGTLFFWELLQAPAGLVLEQAALVESGATGYANRATLRWTPQATDRADTQVLVRVIDSRGGLAVKRLTLAVAGANHLPEIDPIQTITLAEGATLTLPILAADADGDTVTVMLRQLPPGARYDAASGVLSWTPAYDQAGAYNGITIEASDGKHSVRRSFDLIVTQGVARPILPTLPTQVLREGERFALQLPGDVPGGLSQPDGSTVTLAWTAPWLPGGATLDTETGWFDWTPGFAQAGTQRVPITLMATYRFPGQAAPVVTAISRELVLDVRNANGAPVFDPVETWQVLEGQALRISLFAFDPDNPGFLPKLRLNGDGQASDAEGTPASVSYQVLGLPAGASFDADTLELVWTPGYAQAGVYQVTVIATDDGDGTGTPRSTTLVLPIVVNNANRAPSIGEITSATVQRGAVLSIPFSAVDADGNPLTITIDGLPSFASVTQSSAAGGSSASGVIRFAPGAGHRGDYTITVIAQDNGDGDINQVAAEARRFVVSVLSPSEAPVVSVPRQSVALVGQTINIPINVSDLDQDALSYLINGLPAGATIIPAAQYGQATLRWTPTAAQAGVHDLSLEVTDRGLPPADAGFVPDPDHPPVPNTTVADLRIVVRASNLAPELIAITAITASIDGDALAGSLTTVTVDEGAALALNITARDPDFDALHWTVQGQPTGMTLVPVVGTNGQHQLQLRWTPGLFAAQGDNQGGAAPGHYRLVVRATDGSATASREIDVVVRNVNQAPRLLPMPLQLVPEGQTLAFTMLGVDNDNDATRMALVYDATTPEGVSFDTASGYFEWTPGADVVDNASADSRAYNFTFSVTDGTDTTLRTVQVRVFDVNRLPEISTARRALLVGQSFNLPVLRSATAQPGALRIHDPDGAAQTAGLVVSFAGLPEGAAYDSAAGVLRWTPGPGQVGDFIVTASVSDGRNTVREAFTLRVVASPEANAPSILVQTTPEAPVLPGQTVVATVRAESFSPIASIQVWMRGAGAGLADWTPVALDGLGRVRLVPTSPGLIELRVTATDADGFSASQTATVRVRDPLDSAAPVLAWGGALAGSATGAPALIDRTLLLQASVGERQLMGWVLEAAPSSGAVVDESAWRTVATQSFAAAGASGLVDLARVDPAQWANGIYQLRLRAWDLAGRTSEISGRLQVDSASKALLQGSASDAVFTLGGHDFVLGRALDARDGLGQDLGNWRLPALNVGLTNDQGGTSALGLPEPWRDGARVWLQVPGSDGLTPQYLSFTLGTAVQALGSQPGAPVVQRPVFSSDAGWSLQAHDGDETQPVSLQRQGQRLLSQASGLPWVPQGFVLTGPDGTRYSLSASGAVQRITHADGQQWLVSDAGIARVGAADPAQRIEFQRDSAGRIERVVGLRADGQSLSIVYRYDSAGRLILARTLYGGDAASTIGYHADGRLMTEPVSAQLGAAVGWLASAAAPSNAWAGTLQAGTPVHLSFVVRDSELASTIRAAGAAGAVIVAVETTGADLQLTATGATVLGRSTLGQRVVTLLRINEAGLKLLTLNGSGAASLRISLAGDLDRDGRIDGSDSAAWEAAAAAGTLASADLDGDGDADAGDRQLLYANYGWRANQAPVAVNAAERRTHTDLDARTLLDDVAVDLDGDALFWRILGSTHGTARLAGDGQTLVFTPDAGYAGMAEVTLQADDGFASGAPMVLRFNVSGAALQAIHILPMAQLRPGEYTVLQAVGDFADEQGVWLTGGYLSWTVHNFSERAPAADLATGLDGAFLSGSNAGWGHVSASRGPITSARSFEIGGPTQDTMLLALGGLDLYPGAVTLTAPTAGLGSGARQIKLTEVVSGVSVADSPYATYVVGDARVASVDSNGRITALGVGTTQVYALYKSGTPQLTVTVAPPQVLANGAQRVQVDGAGAVLQSAGGVQIAIPAGQFDQPVSVGIQDLALDNLPLALPSNIDLDFTHAFRLDLGDAKTGVPVQLALNVGTAYEAGTEIYVMRRGTILDGNGVEQPVWWVVDNGFVGADGVARTASPPFPGVTSNGDYIVAARRTKFDPKTGAATYKVASISGDAFAMWMQAQTMAMMMAGGSLAGAAVATSILAMGLGMTPLTILDYSSAASYQREGAVRVEGDTLAVDVPPPVPLLADDPVISRIEAVTPGGNEYKITGSYFKLVGQPNVEVQVWLKPVGSGLTELTDEPDRALVWRKLEILSSDYAQLVVRVPEGTAVGLHEFQVKRVVQYRDELGPVPGFYVDQGNPSNAVQLDPQPAVGLVLDRRNLQFTQGSSRFDPANPPSDTGVDPIRVLGEGISLPSYLTGTKTDALAFGPDGRLAFVAAAGRVYMIDMTTRKLVYTIEVEGVPMNITSLAAAGEWLYMAEGNGYGNTAAARLMRINVDAKSPDFLKLQQQLQLPGSIGNGGPGFLDLAVSGGRYLGVTMPRQGGGVIGFGVRDKGDVIVIDLATMQAAYEERARLTGGADRRLIVSDDDVRLIDLGSTGTNAGKAPKFIAPGTEAGQFVVGTPGSYNGGFIAFTAKRPTADAALTVTAPVAPRLNPGPQCTTRSTTRTSSTPRAWRCRRMASTPSCSTATSSSTRSGSCGATWSTSRSAARSASSKTRSVRTRSTSVPARRSKAARWSTCRSRLMAAACWPRPGSRSTAAPATATTAGCSPRCSSSMPTRSSRRPRPTPIR